MASPAVSSSTAGTARPTAPARNKSSASLANASSSRPKRNKSSSSLHAAGGAGHHTVQFAHHAKKGRRSGSTSGVRKGAIDFGFTSLPPARQPDEDETVVGSGDESDGERDGRPNLDARRASSGSVATVKDGSRSREREPEEQVERSRSRSRSRGPPKDRRQLKAPALPSSVASTSDWESATDSPLGLGRTVHLPNVVPPEGAVSGLGQVMGAGDAVTGGQHDDDTPITTPSKKASKGKPRALFEIDDAENEASPPTPPPEVARLPSNAVDSLVAAATPSPAPVTPTIGAVHPSTPSPPVTHTQSPPPVAGPSSVAFPSTASPSTSPVQPRPTGQKRKSSNASVLSLASVRSFAGSQFGNLMAPGLRRSASGAVAPLVALDRVNVEPDVGGGRAGRSHQRTESMTSIRSLRSVAEAAPPRRSATMGVDNGRDVAARLRASKLAPSESSTALAALANLGVASRGSQPSSLANKRSSGYFSSLRNLASLPSFSPPLSPSATRTAPTAAQKGKARASPPTRPQSYLISRFVEPPPVDAPHNLSVSPPAHLAGRTLSSANLALSRTQQKALLARDAPYYEFSPTKMSRQGSEQPRMQIAATGFVKEAERIESQYRAVEKWRDPLGESLERVLAVPKGKA